MAVLSGELTILIIEVVSFIDVERVYVPGGKKNDIWYDPMSNMFEMVSLQRGLSYLF